MADVLQQLSNACWKQVLCSHRSEGRLQPGPNDCLTGSQVPCPLHVIQLRSGGDIEWWAPGSCFYNTGGWTTFKLKIKDSPQIVRV